MKMNRKTVAAGTDDSGNCGHEGLNFLTLPVWSTRFFSVNLAAGGKIWRIEILILGVLRYANRSKQVSRSTKGFVGIMAE